jgi:hypothetical protein
MCPRSSNAPPSVRLRQNYGDWDDERTSQGKIESGDAAAVGVGRKHGEVDIAHLLGDFGEVPVTHGCLLLRGWQRNARAGVLFSGIF